MKFDFKNLTNQAGLIIPVIALIPETTDERDVITLLGEKLEADLSKGNTVAIDATNFFAHNPIYGQVPCDEMGTLVKNPTETGKSSTTETAKEATTDADSENSEENADKAE